MKRILPLSLFVLLIGLLAAGLRLDPHYVPSPLVGKPAPDFRLDLLNRPGQQLSPSDLRGKVWLLNVWASWCSICREEHEVLLELAKQGDIPVYGMDYKDQPQDARQMLASLGNPYVATVSDPDGHIGIDYGVYGVPETYVIDKDGIVRQKLSGAITRQNLEALIRPLVKELQR